MVVYKYGTSLNGSQLHHTSILPPKSPKPTMSAKKTSDTKKSPKAGKKGQRVRSYSGYIYKVLKQVHPDTGISMRAMSVVDGFIHAVIEKVAVNVSELLGTTKHRTVTSREIQSAVRLALPGELAKHAVSEGTKAVTKFNANPPGKTGKKLAGDRHSASFRAGLQFPVRRIGAEVMMNVKSHSRRGAGAPVYLAAVLEYLVAEILELAGNASRDHKRTRIIPRHLMLAIANDEELNKLVMWGGLQLSPGYNLAVIPSGGVLPKIHSILLPHSKKGEKKVVGEY